MDKMERIACLYLTFINSPGGISFTHLKKHMPLAYQGDVETVRRKFERDKEQLKSLGLELQYKPTGQTSPAVGQSHYENHVYVPKEAIHYLPDITLTEADYRSLATLLLRAILDPERSYRERESIRIAANKLFYKNPSYIHKTNADTNQMNIYNQKPFFFAHEEKFLELVHQALKQHKTLKISYENRREEQELRLVSGRGLISHKGRWCLIAYCHKAKDIRHFYIDRISAAKLSEDPYKEIPRFDIRKYSLHPLTLPIHKPRRVMLQANVEYEENLRSFLEGARRTMPYYQEKKDKYIFETSNLPALFSWILQQGNAIKGLAPTSVREEFLAYLKQVKSLYEVNPSSENTL